MTWIDIYGNHRRDCIGCGRFAMEGNICYVCWNQNQGEGVLDTPWIWSNTDSPILRNREDTAEGLYHFNKDGDFVLK